MIFFIFAMTISPSAYFTYGDITKQTKSYSVASYLTFNLKQHYILTSYSYYSENYQSGHLKQQTFSLGYTKTISRLLGFRTNGFYISNSVSNISGIFSGRLFYGYNPVFTIGGAVSNYAKSFNHQRFFYNTLQINPEVRYFTQKKIWLNFGINYTNAASEDYQAFIAGFNIILTSKLNLKINGSYGEIFYQIDDRQLIINNRPNLQKGSIAVNTKYNVTNKLKLAFILQKDFYNKYNINYYVLGLEFN